VIIDVITIFPELIRSAAGFGILRRAQDAGAVQLTAHDLRDFAPGRHRSTDDTPYGGGAGMVMTCEPLFAAVESLDVVAGTPVVMLSPQGETLTQTMVRELSAAPRLVLLCGRYEGFDERVREHLATHEVSIGDYVVTGGEIPALVLIDAVARLLPGVLGNEESAQAETFSEPLLEYPQYTRPTEFRGWRVPEVLLSGHHAEIAQWRRKEQLRRTRERRPDLWAEFKPLKSDLELLTQLPEIHPLTPRGREVEENL
jgi:tRNA (guanine37-N1)-methyltransferase